MNVNGDKYWQNLHISHSNFILFVVNNGKIRLRLIFFFLNLHQFDVEQKVTRGCLLSNYSPGGLTGLLTGGN